MGVEPKKTNKPIAKLLDAAGLAAVRLHRGLINTRDHDLVILIDGRPGGEPRALPAGDPWRERFRPFEPLSAYATAFRYSLSPPPNVNDLRRMLTSLSSLHKVARTELLST
jgi:hypothetical protein